ncbi:hypothetical protein CROQUDRAFT_655211 [Cronartium quercuum f. sp. fusiforme G11]|uniref:Uncharacterized protein n=1 Tax=Cronartium quercuum f. sp. fusiforme G11 TaxID=708437 RepID=A0A9P6NPW0_9BASI|nr:hypothetical protein CROQUDRAFT_655211 [Cronartium quercuum f. sp. fusiforme G11]
MIPSRSLPFIPTRSIKTNKPKNLRDQDFLTDVSSSSSSSRKILMPKNTIRLPKERDSIESFGPGPRPNSYLPHRSLIDIQSGSSYETEYERKRYGDDHKMVSHQNNLGFSRDRSLGDRNVSEQSGVVEPSSIPISFDLLNNRERLSTFSKDLSSASCSITRPSSFTETEFPLKPKPSLFLKRKPTRVIETPIRSKQNMSDLSNHHLNSGEVDRFSYMSDEFPKTPFSARLVTHYEREAIIERQNRFRFLTNEVDHDHVGNSNFRVSRYDSEINSRLSNNNNNNRTISLSDSDYPINYSSYRNHN